MTQRSFLGPVVIALVLIGLVTTFSAGRSWASSTVVATGLIDTPVHATGRAAHPAVFAVGLLIAACGLGVLAARGWLRRAIGVLTAAVSVWLGLTILLNPIPGSTSRRAFDEVPGTLQTWHVTVWPWFTVVLLLMAALLGATVAAFGHRWATMSKRYDAPSDAIDDDPWSVLDRGEDPTR